MWNIKWKLANLTDTIVSSGHIGSLAENSIVTTPPTGEITSAVTSGRTGYNISAHIDTNKDQQSLQAYLEKKPYRFVTVLCCSFLFLLPEKLWLSSMFPVVVLGKNIWGPGPSSFGRQQRLSKITIEPIKNLRGLGKIWGLCPLAPT